MLADTAIYRRMLKDHVSKIKNAEIIGEASTGNALVRLCCKQRPDIIITGIHIPNKNGIEASEIILAAWPRTKIIAISKYDDNDWIGIIKAGAKACLDSRNDLHELCSAIQAVQNNQTYFSPKILRRIYKLIRDFAIPQKQIPEKINTEPKEECIKKLSPMEIEVIKLICEGYTNQMMGDYLGLSKRTVETYRESILRKTGETNTASVVVFAIRNKIYDINA